MSDGVRAYTFGPYRFDTRDRELTRDGQPVPVTPKALAILLALVERHGHIVEKADLMQRVWPETAVEEANLTQNIFVLRKALGEAVGEQKYIATVARRGYRFVAETSEVRDSEPGRELASPPTHAGGRASIGGWRLALAGSGLVVAMAVAGGWLSGQASTARRPTLDPAAHEAYLRGRHFWGLRSEDALRKSIEYYRLAVQHDPTFAAAYAGLAQVYGPYAYYGFAPPADAFPAMRAAAEKALELDPTLVDAHVALAAEITTYQWDWPRALRAWRRVLDRHPNHAVARHWHGLLLETLGRFDEALAERLRAVELDPLSLQFNTSVAVLLHRMGRREEAIARFRRTLELESEFTGAHLGLGQALLMSGRTGEGMVALRHAVSLSNDALSHAILGYACAVTGDTAGARTILGELERRAHERYLPPAYLAYVYIGLGDVDSAFARLGFAERARFLSASSAISCRLSAVS